MNFHNLKISTRDVWSLGLCYCVGHYGYLTKAADGNIISTVKISLTDLDPKNSYYKLLSYITCTHATMPERNLNAQSPAAEHKAGD